MNENEYDAHCSIQSGPVSHCIELSWAGLDCDWLFSIIHATISDPLLSYLEEEMFLSYVSEFKQHVQMQVYIEYIVLLVSPSETESVVARQYSSL